MVGGGGGGWWWWVVVVSGGGGGGGGWWWWAVVVVGVGDVTPPAGTRDSPVIIARISTPTEWNASMVLKDAFDGQACGGFK